MKKVELNIPYHIAECASLQVRYYFDSECDTAARVQPLRELSPDVWHAEILIDKHVDKLFYTYEYVRAGKVARSEWSGFPHELRINSVNSSYVLHDRWMDSPSGYYMYTALFGLFHALDACGCEFAPNWYGRSVTVSLPLQGVLPDETPVLVGDADILGGWNVADAPVMHRVAYNMWSVTFDASAIGSAGIQFKVALRASSGVARWEEGANRSIVLPESDAPTAYFHTYDALYFDAPRLRLAGTVIPLFSIRSHDDWGVGDFGCLKKMVDWLACTGQSVLQLLPVNDTTVYGGKEDSYPYNCISVFALNPIYMDITALPKLDSARRNSYYEKQRRLLSDTPVVDYGAVYALKMSYLRELFDQKGSDTLSSAAYRTFVAVQKEWLQPYAMYRFLVSRLGCNMNEWGSYARCTPSTYSFLVAEYPEAQRETDFYTYVQYLLFTQLSHAHGYANSKRIALKGDIPIGVAPNGVDVWCNAEQFNLSVSAGAPPDAFSANGQNWGFPTYNWQRMAADGYVWWRRRLQYMSNFFDAYRIDHILGFFRIWEIPRWAVSGLAGVFSPSMPLSVSEIKSYGFHFDKVSHTRAYINKVETDAVFADMASYVIEHYLEPVAPDIYTFKDAFRSPQALRDDLYSAHSPLNYTLKEELLAMFAQVLFFPSQQAGLGYTPRIDASSTLAYTMLSAAERSAYDRLYEEYFYRRHTGYWYEEGMRKLVPVLLSTPMTACGEDLGMIPACVPWVMKNLQIMSLEIQRMPKQYGCMFDVPSRYPYLSVATPSTHDMSTLRGWWREDTVVTQRFYNEILGCDGEAPAEMSGSIATAVIRSHMASPSALALFAWQDILAMDERLRRSNPDDERVNVPSNRYHVWNYRMHISVEQMMQERGFNDTLRAMIEECGRVVR